MSFPQLRVRTGFSTREVFGTLPAITKRLKEIGCSYAAVVDVASTWSHAKWEQECAKSEITPGFGMEFAVYCESKEETNLPRAWALAHDTTKLYNLTTKVHQNDRRIAAADLRDLQGLFTFVGGAVEVARKFPNVFDYADINPSNITHAKAVAKLARETDMRMVVTSYNDMPGTRDEDAAYAWEVRDAVGPRHIMGLDEIRVALVPEVLTEEEFDAAVKNTIVVAGVLDQVKLKKAPIIKVDGCLRSLCEAGKGRIEEWTQEYEDRLEEELRVIQSKGFDSYFLVVADIVQYAKQHMLVGPGRGSACGSLVCYLTGITELDPIPHHLLFSRFLDESRSDMPDIDIDFPDNKRHMVLEYLQNKFGPQFVSQMGNVNTLQPLSVIAQVSKKFGLEMRDCDGIRNIVKGDPDKTLSDVLEGDSFSIHEPDAARCMKALEGHPSHYGVHAAAILVCNDKISDYCTVNAEGVAQIDKHDAEYLNLLKIDALGLRTLGIIEDAGVMKTEDFYALELHDDEAFDIINSGKVSDIFQFSGQALRGISRQLVVKNFKMIDHITSLARPGPMSSGMVDVYVARATGQAKIKSVHPLVDDVLVDTYGVLVYQEQIMKILNAIGGFTWGEVNKLRKGMAKSMGQEFFAPYLPRFLDGAKAVGMEEVAAQKLWDELVEFGKYGFNRAHSAAYGVVSYWCCYIKAHFPLQWACANLRNAKDDPQTMEILRDLAADGIPYTAFDPKLSGVNWEVRTNEEGKPVLVGGIQNVKGYGPAKSLAFLQKREAGELTEADFAKFETAEVKFADLNEARTKWGHLYDKPSRVKVFGDIKQMIDVRDGKEGVFLCKLVKKSLLSENDPQRLKKRNGKLFDGPPEFADFSVVDDSISTPITVRIRPDNFSVWGQTLFDNCGKDDWFLVRGWKIPDFNMFIGKKMMKLNPEIHGKGAFGI